MHGRTYLRVTLGVLVFGAGIYAALSCVLWDAAIFVTTTMAISRGAKLELGAQWLKILTFNAGSFALLVSGVLILLRVRRIYWLTLAGLGLLAATALLDRFI